MVLLGLLCEVVTDECMDDGLRGGGVVLFAICVFLFEPGASQKLENNSLCVD